MITVSSRVHQFKFHLLGCGVGNGEHFQLERAVLEVDGLCFAAAPLAAPLPLGGGGHQGTFLLRHFVSVSIWKRKNA